VVEGAAYGVALLAGVGAGAWPDVSTACTQVIKVTAVTTPDEKQVEKYGETYRLYGEVYPALKSSFQKMR
jgi:xylulokinase